MFIRLLIAILLVVQLAGCAWFGHRGCRGADCNTPQLLAQSAPPHKWYCYGESDGQSWNCLDKPDTSRIVAIKPETRPPVSADQVPGAGSTVATATEPMKPPTDITQSILDQPDDHYTVQLTAGHDEQELLQYARSHGVTQPVYVVVPGQNGPTYILLLGVYADQDKALDAKSIWERNRSLQAEPWVRKLGPLQQAIKANQKRS